MPSREQLAVEVDRAFDYRRWQEQIGWMNFPSDWLWRPVPNFGGAIVRFQVRHMNNPGHVISVYLDGYEMLGSFRQVAPFRDLTTDPVTPDRIADISIPYWEVYPHNGDTARVVWNDMLRLVRTIQEALDVVPDLTFRGNPARFEMGQRYEWVGGTDFGETLRVTSVDQETGTVTVGRRGDRVTSTPVEELRPLPEGPLLPPVKKPTQKLHDAVKAALADGTLTQDELVHQLLHMEFTLKRIVSAVERAKKTGPLSRSLQRLAWDGLADRI